MLCRTKQKEQRKFSQLINRKAKLLSSKVAYVLHNEHEHYFSKEEVLQFNNRKSLKSGIDPRCKVCGLRLSDYRNKIRYDTMEFPALKDADENKGKPRSRKPWQ